LVAPKKQVSLSNVDRWLQAYTRFTSTAVSQDKGLKSLQYTLWLVGRFTLPHPASSNNDNSGPPPLLVKRSLGPAISIAWLACRPLWKPFARARGEEEEEDLHLRPLLPALEKPWPGVCLHTIPSNMWPISNGKYPHSLLNERRGRSQPQPPPQPPQQHSEDRLAAKASAWLCRFWLVYIVLDMVRSAVMTLQTLTNKKSSSPEDDDDDSEFKCRSEAQTQMCQSERLQLLRNVLFTVPCLLHWSLQNWDVDPWLSSDLVNGLRGMMLVRTIN
jgi:hypothetical protein